MTEEDRPRRRARPLTDDERKLWSTVARAIKPLRGGRKSEPHAPEDLPSPKPAMEARADIVPASPKPPSQPAAPPLAPLGRRVRQRLGRGSEPIDGRIDLHGMTQAQAHPALTGFLRSAQASGAKTVLVITGKGARGDIPFAERGVLRRLVPQWLDQPELRAIVLGFEPAGVGHGGEGALYVRLRRAKGAP